MIGASVASYRILGPLGEGGMGVVYRAEHVLLGRPAAVKVLLPELSRNQEIVNRFFNEARAATAIRHPSIVEIYDFGYHADGSAFIVMELLEGESLSRRLARLGRLELSRAVAIARQIAGALSAAHARGIVHRDLKPDNVFLVSDPEVPGGERIKLLDFGIAKLATEPTGMRTRTGSVMGTPTYMAPEQCRGVAVDHRADLYSLGCILFEMTLGAPPFRGEGSGDVLAAHIHLAPPLPRSVAADVPVPLENLILDLLAKPPDKRPPSAGHVVQMIDGLGIALRPEDVGTSPARAAAPRTMPTTLSGAARVTEVTRRGASSRWGTYGLVGVAVLTAGVAVLVGRAAVNDESPSSSSPVAAASVPPPPVVPAAPTFDAALPPDAAEAAPVTVPDPAAPTSIDLEITSSPRGAEILLGTTSLGRTPLHTAIASAPSVILVVRLPGHVDATVNASGDAPIRRHVVLKKRSRPETNRNPF